MGKYVILIVGCLGVCLSLADASKSHNLLDSFISNWVPPLTDISKLKLVLIKQTEEMGDKILVGPGGGVPGLVCWDGAEIIPKDSDRFVLKTDSSRRQNCIFRKDKIEYGVVGTITLEKSNKKIEEQFTSRINFLKQHVVMKQAYTFVFGVEEEITNYMSKVGMKPGKFIAVGDIADKNTPDLQFFITEENSFLGMKLDRGTFLQGTTSKYSDRFRDEIYSISSPLGKSIKYQGATCSILVLLKNNLDQCVLSENLKYKKLTIPKGVSVYFDISRLTDGRATPMLIHEIPSGTVINGEKILAGGVSFAITEDGLISRKIPPEILEKTFDRK